MPKPVIVRLFATARETAGTDRIERPTGPRGVSVRTVLAELATTHPGLGAILRHSRFARNGTYLRGRSGMLRSGDELAIHPPYSGG